jgi:hypothetical protein
MTVFTQLELAALHSIFSETPELTQQLERQLSVATVTERENTGVGFFTRIAVPPSLSQSTGRSRSAVKRTLAFPALSMDWGSSSSWTTGGFERSKASRTGAKARLHST